MLEEHDKIDTIAVAKDGFVELVIMDAGLTEDPEERFSHLIAKLKAYVYYVIEGDFKKDYPDKTQKDVRLVVMCRILPTVKMSKLARIANPENPEAGFDIQYRHFPGSDGSDVAPAHTAQTARRKLPLYIGLGLAALTLAASLIGWINTDRSPLPGIIVALVFAGFGFLMARKRLS